jgi:hypothetical protein
MGASAGTPGVAGVAGISGAGGGCNEPTPQPTITVRDGCVGEVFTEDLSLDNQSIEWSGTVPSDLGLTLAPSGVLSGVLLKSAHYEFDLTARTPNCPLSKRHIIMQVRGEEASACPTIRRLAQPVEILAPEACVGWPYSAKFEVTGGSPPYSWQAPTLPTGFNLNPQTVELSSAATFAIANPAVTLQVTDHNGRIIQRALSVALRQKCWFGYVSNETGVARVHLVDPQLGTHLQRPVTNTADLSVEDFKWSPDGKFVAYRVKKTNGDYALWLWQGPLWDRDLELLLDGSVLHYAWSPDAGVLGVVTTANGQNSLGGVNVASVPRESAPGTIQGVVTLTPLDAAVDSELTWYGEGTSRAVAFHKAGRGDFSKCRNTGHATLGTLGFESLAWALSYNYCNDVFIYPSRAGYFASVDGALNYHPNDSSATVYHDNDALSPSADFTAVAVDSTLELRRANLDFWEDATATTQGCGHLLAWGEARERIACTGADESSFWTDTLNSDASAFTTALVSGSTSALAAGWSGYPRLMSRSANWLAIATADRLHLASLAGTPQFTWSAALASSNGTSLAFSPDESLLTVQRGNQLWLYNVPGSTASGIALGTLGSEPAACSEAAFGLPNWCGSSRGEPAWKWAADSRAIALVTASGNLAIDDLRLWHSRQEIVETVVTPNCSGACATQFRFQP